MPQAMLNNPRGANSTALPFSTNSQKLPVEFFDLVTNSAITGNQPVIHIPHATAPTGKVTKALSSSDSLLFAGIADTIRWGSGSAAAGDTVRVVTKGVVENVTSSGAITAGDAVQLSAAADGTVVAYGTNTNPAIGFAVNTASSNKVTLYLFGGSNTNSDLNVVDDLVVGDALTVAGTATFNGNVLLGNNASVDTVTVTADVTFASGADLTVVGATSLGATTTGTLTATDLTATGNVALGNLSSADTVTITADTTFASGSDLIWGATDGATIKGIFNSGTISVTVPTIADAESDSVAVSTAALTFACAVGDQVIVTPIEALPTDCLLQGAYVSNTDEVTVCFGTKEGGGGVTGAAKNFNFLFFDMT